MAVPTTAKAARVLKRDTPVVVEDLPVPKPGADDVLVQVTAAAINPVDWKLQSTAFLPEDKFPIVLGSDAAGVVAAVGSNVTNLKIGDRVFFQGHIPDNDRCTFRQYTLVPSKLVGRLPENVSDDQGAGISLASIAGVTALYADEGLKFKAPWEQGGDKVGAGKGFVVLGGSSSVGLYAVQLARLSGFEVITNSSAAHMDRLKSLGAAHVLDRNAAKPEDYAKALGGKPLAGILDGISEASTQKLAVEIFKAAGAKGAVATVQAKKDEAVKAGEPIGVEIRGVMGLGQAPHLAQLSEGFHRALGGDDGWLAKGAYVPNIPEVVPGGLAALQTALDKSKRGVSGVKLVVHPQEGL